ncbi:hypothetical protein [Salinarimonas rosea]|uniref:hypothetical protein n=1 Tax=Salinarimonas rosea TaxID=552063 RepID=UPI000491DC24|nr:hypothetical protein [Salinarimonas rosea]
MPRPYPRTWRVVEQDDFLSQSDARAWIDSQIAAPPSGYGSPGYGLGSYWSPGWGRRWYAKVTWKPTEPAL